MQGCHFLSKPVIGHTGNDGASHTKTKMAHQLLSIFNSLDTSPSNVPILSVEAAREDGEKNRRR